MEALTIQISGRNKLKGNVTNIITGTVTAEVELDIGNGNIITGVITKRSLDDLQIRPGDQLTAFFLYTLVILFKA